MKTTNGGELTATTPRDREAKHAPFAVDAAFELDQTPEPQALDKPEAPIAQFTQPEEGSYQWGLDLMAKKLDNPNCVLCGRTFEYLGDFGYVVFVDVLDFDSAVKACNEEDVKSQSRNIFKVICSGLPFFCRPVLWSSPTKGFHHG